MCSNLFTCVKTCSNLFKTCSNMFKCVQMCSNMFKLVQNLFKCVQMCSNVFKLVQNLFKCVQMCSNMFKLAQNLFKRKKRLPKWLQTPLKIHRNKYTPTPSLQDFFCSRQGPTRAPVHETNMKEEEPLPPPSTVECYLNPS